MLLLYQVYMYTAVLYEYFVVNSLLKAWLDVVCHGSDIMVLL